MDNVTASSVVVPIDQSSIIDELFQQLSPLPMICSSHDRMIEDHVDELMMMLAAASPENPTFPVVSPGELQLQDDHDEQPRQLMKKRKKYSSADQKNPKLADYNTKKRKTKHRDVERQRRHEMSTLYRSLRSHIPIHLLKGKRSTCDHIDEAVKYIKHLEKNILGLNTKKDELKKKLSSLPPVPTPTYTPPLHLNRIDSSMKVKVTPCMAGLEIAVDTDSKQGVSLSRLLGFLTHEGLALLTYTSTRVNKRLLHSIKSEVSEHHGRSVEVFELQQRLMSLNYLGLD